MVKNIKKRSANKAGNHRKTTNNSRLNKGSGGLWFYGRHAVVAAIKNPNREIKRILATKSGREILEKEVGKKLDVQIVDAQQVMQYTPEGMPNQGIVAQVGALKQKALCDIENARLIMILDHVTDPHNIGAILRSCGAFGADGVVVHEHHCPDETGTMAKSASGALEIVPLIKVGNLSKTIDELKGDGFWIVGMDGKSDMNLKDVPVYEKIAIVMGAEGKGLRRLTAEQCDVLAKLPIKRTVESLNVSNAAAIALYELG